VGPSPCPQWLAARASWGVSVPGAGQARPHLQEGPQGGGGVGGTSHTHLKQENRGLEAGGRCSGRWHGQCRASSWDLLPTEPSHSQASGRGGVGGRTVAHFSPGLGQHGASILYILGQGSLSGHTPADILFCLEPCSTPSHGDVVGGPAMLSYRPSVSPSPHGVILSPLLGVRWEERRPGVRRLLLSYPRSHRESLTLTL
jgi:hypothetical protein